VKKVQNRPNHWLSILGENRGGGHDRQELDSHFKQPRKTIISKEEKTTGGKKKWG